MLNEKLTTKKVKKKNSEPKLARTDASIDEELMVEDEEGTAKFAEFVVVSQTSQTPWVFFFFLFDENGFIYLKEHMSSLDGTVVSDVYESEILYCCRGDQLAL